MRVLVTGSNGFIGRHVIAHMVHVTDWDVIALDVRHDPGFEHARITRVYVDLTKPFVLPDPLDEVDAVVNLASLADVSSFLEHPALYMSANVEMTLTMLEWARHRTLRHFIQVSTNEVYGPSYAGEAHQEWSPIRPPTPYSASKAAQEAACHAWWYSYSVPVIILNAMHVFGEEQPINRFIPSTIDRLLAGEPVSVYAQQVAPERWVPSRRNWLYVRDLADAIVWNLSRPAARGYQLGLRTDAEHPVRFNVAGPSMNCVSVVARIARLLGVEPKVEYVDVRDARPGHELVYELDGRSIRIAGWQPPFGFSSGLERTVTFWRNA